MDKRRYMGVIGQLKADAIWNQKLVEGTMGLLQAKGFANSSLVSTVRSMDSLKHSVLGLGGKFNQDSFIKAHSMFPDALITTKMITKDMGIINNSLNLWRHDLGLFSDPIKQIIPEYRTFVSDKNRINKSLMGIAAEYANVSFDSSGAATIANQVISPEEIAEGLKEVIPTTIYGREIEDILSNIVDNLVALKKPLAFILLHFLLPYFVAIFAYMTTGYVDSITKNITGNNRQEHKKCIKEQACKTFNPEDLLFQRFVVADVLNIREKPSAKSKCIDNLEFSKVVTLLQKNRNWSLIEYYDEESEEHRKGWVFSRYLAKLSK